MVNYIIVKLSNSEMVSLDDKELGEQRIKQLRPVLEDKEKIG